MMLLLPYLGGEAPLGRFQRRLHGDHSEADAHTATPHKKSETLPLLKGSLLLSQLYYIHRNR